jgi:hypothetical protein
VATEVLPARRRPTNMEHFTQSMFPDKAAVLSTNR